MSSLWKIKPGIIVKIINVGSIFKGKGNKNRSERITKHKSNVCLNERNEEVINGLLQCPYPT